MLRATLIAISAIACLAVPAAAASLLLDVKAAKLSASAITGLPELEVELADDDVQRLAKFTTRHVGERVEMRIDGALVMKPMIQTPILGGTIIITGQYSSSEWSGMADRLATGQTQIEIVLP